jgi:hypothetical protein
MCVPCVCCLPRRGAQYDQVPVHVLKEEPRQPEHLAPGSHPFGKEPDNSPFEITALPPRRVGHRASENIDLL